MITPKTTHHWEACVHRAKTANLDTVIKKSVESEHFYLSNKRHGGQEEDTGPSSLQDLQQT